MNGSEILEGSFYDKKGEELRSWVEDTLSAEGEMVYHVIITFDVADFV